MRRKVVLATLAALLTVFAWSDGRLFGGHARADTVTVAATTPVLTIPTSVLAAGDSTVTVPIHFDNNLRGVAAIAFSLNFDSACLALDLQQDVLKPGVVAFNLPPQFNGSAYYEKDVPGGRIDIVLGDYAVPLSTLPNTQSLVTVTFRTTCMPPEGTTIVAPVTFSAQLAGSYSDTLGHPLTGHFVDGSVAIKHWIPAPTVTPAPTAGPTPVVNSAPIAKDDDASTKMSQPVTINVLANDMDPDGDPMSIISVTQGGLGLVKANANGTIVYTPTAERSGEDRFTYTVSDGKGGLAAAAVRVTVAAANKPPIAMDDKADTDEDIAVAINAISNDTDPDASNTLLSIGVLGQPAHGIVHINVDGSAEYTPDANFSGKDSFVYAVVDKDGGSAIATVSITVRPVDDPPPVLIDEVDLSDFSVHEVDGKLQLDWSTSRENDSTGYYIYRTHGTQIQTGLLSMPYFDAWKRISPLIQSKSSSGGRYRYIDDTVQPNVPYAYILVAIDRDDNINLFGPRAAAATPVDKDIGKDICKVLLPCVVRN